MDDDPTGPHAHHRIHSPENVFRRCPFAGDPKSDGDSDSDSDSSDFEAFRIESTGIFMLSLPDSLDEKDDNTPHLYQTPPEELAPTGSEGQRSETAADANGDDWKAVDLGRDTDVGLYSEVQSTSETGEREKSVEIIGVCRSRIFGSEEEDFGFHESEVSLGESSSKKLKLSGDSSRPSSCTRTVRENFPVDSTNFGGGSMSHNNGDEGKLSNGESGDINCNYNEKSAEKKVEESVKNTRGMDDGKVFNGDNGVIHCNCKEKSAGKEVEESVKNFEPHQPIKLQENQMGNRHQLSSRLLPASISGVKNNAAAGTKSSTSEDPVVVTLLEILKVLKGEEGGEFDDESLSKLSILDIVQRRGMTFPRPEWWPPEV